ncbi:uncharacterized protein LOC142973853 [Anticarsia gemmatalis]|uniref:uncharacterized protein LOC142973853 n=1 Tax=Anticarsia gemmatalis TaxID=129554 RepID=UPI003F76641C
MAMSSFVTFATVLFLATSNAAPTDDGINVLKVPEKCKQPGFCSVKPAGYDELVKKIDKALPDILKQEFEDRDKPETELPKVSPESDWHNCPYETRTESMYLYHHGENSTKIDIIVQTKLFRQRVEVVQCLPKATRSSGEVVVVSGDEQCFADLGLSRLAMKSECVTSTAQRTLYIFDEEKEKIVQKAYAVPACCSCRVSYKNE